MTRLCHRWVRRHKGSTPERVVWLQFLHGWVATYRPRPVRSLDEFRENIVEKLCCAVLEAVLGHGADKAYGADGEDLATPGDRYVDHVRSHHVGTVGAVGIRDRSALILRRHEIFRSKACG